MKRTYVVVAFVSAATLLVAIFGLVLSLQQQPLPQSTPARNYAFNVVANFTHDVNAFTEGLAFNNGSLFEGTGEYGNSELRRVDLPTGDVLQDLRLPSDYFGEGITVVGEQIVQLTWQNSTGFVYDKQTFNLQRQFSYSTEGWGLTFDGDNLVMSDGTDRLTFFNPSTFQILRQVSVHDGNISVTKLNELEYVNGFIYANVWLEGKIVIINPENGLVKGWVNLGNLEGDLTYQANGIAYDQQNNKLFVTGKNWMHLYQITLVPQT